MSCASELRDASCLLHPSILLFNHLLTRKHTFSMSANWDDDFGSPVAGPSFVDRARNAPDDDDFPIADDFGGRRPVVLAQDVAEETPFQQLIRHWMNERHASDILPGQEMLLGRLLDHIRKQVSVQSFGMVVRGVQGELADRRMRLSLITSSSSPTTSNYCAPTRTLRKRSTSASCSSKQRLSASSLSSGHTSEHDYTR